MKRQKRLSRVISILLTLALVLSLLPTQALAQSATRSFAEVEKYKIVATMSSNEQVVNQAIEDIKKLPEDFLTMRREILLSTRASQMIRSIWQISFMILTISMVVWEYSKIRTISK